MHTEQGESRHGQFSATHDRPRLLRRLKTLRNVEWFNIPFLVLVLYLAWSDRSMDALWQRLTAYALVAFLLLIGGWYWHLKVAQIGRGRSIESQLTTLARIRMVASVILGCTSVALVASWIAGIGHTADRGWATGFLVLAWAEYVNYFHYQLMHDTRSDLERLRRTGKLRRSWLAADLDGMRRGGA